MMQWQNGFLGVSKAAALKAAFYQRADIPLWQLDYLRLLTTRDLPNRALTAGPQVTDRLLEHAKRSSRTDLERVGDR